MAHLRRTTRLSAALALTCALAACGGEDSAASPTAPSPRVASAAPPSVTPGSPTVDLSAPEALATGLEAPWGVAWLPDGDALVSERDSGRVLRLPSGGGEPQELARLDVRNDGEGGLLGLAVAPDGSQVYAYLTTDDDNRVIRFPADAPEEQTVILDGITRAAIHNGGRLAFGPDGMLYISTGDAGERGASQDRGDLNGKILRVTPDGEVPGDNPFDGSPVWSLGHRNVQGLAWDAADRLYASEFGQNTFDEVNLIEAGNNYGWPVVEGRGDTRGGEFTDPIVTWQTSEASPSGAGIVGDTLYVAALRGARLWAVPLDGSGGAGEPSVALEGLGRLRTAAQAPDGSLWVLTSNTDGRGSPGQEDDRVLRYPAA